MYAQAYSKSVHGSCEYSGQNSPDLLGLYGILFCCDFHSDCYYN